MQEVHVAGVEPSRLARYIGPERTADLVALSERARERFHGQTVWNVNSTASGGGVAEMLAQMVAYGIGAGVDTRWLVMAGDPAFFTVTKRIHNNLHGVPGDGGGLGPAEHGVYDDASARAAAELLERIRPDDLVVLHDPQTAGLCAAVARAGAHPVWRCHVGADTPNARTEAAWEFLRPYLDSAEHLVFSRPAHVPGWASGRPLTIVAPAIDPFSPKNAEMEDSVVRAVLVRAGILGGDPGPGRAVYTRADGSEAEVTRRADVIGEGDPPTAADRLVIQVSRWDRLKDMAGVMRGFAEHVAGRPEVENGAGRARLVLVGPSVAGVSDDPEGQLVLDECTALFGSLPAVARARISLVSLPMADVEENAAMVNAVQRQATLVVQKSLAEGFGLTVSEAMWKGRPVVASAVGGIQDQLEDGKTGVLLPDPTDLEAFGAAVCKLLADPLAAAECGAAARERVRARFLPDRQLTDWAGVLTEVD